MGFGIWTSGLRVKGFGFRVKRLGFGFRGELFLTTALIRQQRFSFTRRILQMRAVPIGTVLNLRITVSQKCAAVPRRARIEGS